GLAVWGIEYGEDVSHVGLAVGRPLEHRSLLTGRGVAELDGMVFAGAGQGLPIGRERYGPDSSRMSLDNGPLLTRGGGSGAREQPQDGPDAQRERHAVRTDGHNATPPF